MAQRENLNAWVPPSLFCFSSDRGRKLNRRGLRHNATAVIFSVLSLASPCHAAESVDAGQTASVRIALPDDGAFLLPFFPPKENRAGCAVLIVPESGPTSDGATSLAKWLSTQGIAGFILRSGPPSADRNATATDVSRALRYLRAQSADWDLPSRHLGLLGFGRGAELAAQVAYLGDGATKDPAVSDAAVRNEDDHPDFIALIGGAVSFALGKGPLPPTFLVGSARSSDGMSGMIELWGRLRAARTPVDAHFFARADGASGLAPDQASLGPWPEMLHAWLRASGFLTDAPRLAIKGMVYLDGQPLAHGYVIFTPVDHAAAGTGPVIGRVLNSTVGVPIGEFSLPAEQGPAAGRYGVEVRQNMTRWLSNSFSGELVNARGVPSPAQVYFGHHRRLEPSIDDQHAYAKVHPSDREEATIEFQPGAAANLQLKIEVFSR